MFGDIMGKVKEARRKMESIKAHLETISVEGNDPDQRVHVVCNGNRLVQEIKITDTNTVTSDHEALESAIKEAVNDAISKANEIAEEEMKKVAKDMLPPIPGLM
jgi:hypothetical protein